MYGTALIRKNLHVLSLALSFHISGNQWPYMYRGYCRPGVHHATAQCTSSNARHLRRRRELHLQLRHQLVLADVLEGDQPTLHEADGRGTEGTEQRSVQEGRMIRGHGVTLAKKQFRLDIRILFFSQRTVN